MLQIICTTIILVLLILLYINIMYTLLIVENKYNFILKTKNQIFILKLVLFLIIFIGIRIFILRLCRIGRIRNIYIIWNKLKTSFLAMPLKVLICSSILVFFMFLLWFLSIKIIMQYIKKSLLALYLYLLPKSWFNKIIHKLRRVNSIFWHFPVTIVCKYTSNINIIGIMNFIIPYLVIFDILVYDGDIVHIFYNLLWFYIYSIIRTNSSLILTYFTMNNILIADKLYN